jgi:hypothetical protein
MKTVIVISFPDESVTMSRRATFDGPVPIPNLGEHVQNRVHGPNQPVSGTVVSRSFSFTDNEVVVALTLRNNY